MIKGCYVLLRTAGCKTSVFDRRMNSFSQEFCWFDHGDLVWCAFLVLLFGDLSYCVKQAWLNVWLGWENEDEGGISGFPV